MRHQGGISSAKPLTCLKIILEMIFIGWLKIVEFFFSLGSLVVEERWLYCIFGRLSGLGRVILVANFDLLR